MAGQKKALTEKEIKRLKRLLKAENSKRDLVLFLTQLDTMLRSSDLLNLKVRDVMDSNGVVQREFSVRQQKTADNQTVRLQEDTRKHLEEYIIEEGKTADDFLFTGRKNTGRPITHAQHTRLVKKWCDWLNLDAARYSTHSLRRTKAAIIYKNTNNIEVARQILGHRSVASTSAYLNISKTDALDIADQFKL